VGKRKRREPDPTEAYLERCGWTRHTLAWGEGWQHPDGGGDRYTVESARAIQRMIDAAMRRDRQHWAHMQDGDKLIWRLVAELVELRDAQAVTVGAPTLKHHSFQNDRVEIRPDAPNPEWERFLDGLSIEELRRRITAQKQMLVETVANGEAALDAERTSKLDVVRHLRMRIGEHPPGWRRTDG
jgi:hypothetical protein